MESTRLSSKKKNKMKIKLLFDCGKKFLQLTIWPISNIINRHSWFFVQITSSHSDGSDQAHFSNIDKNFVPKNVQINGSLL